MTKLITKFEELNFDLINNKLVIDWDLEDDSFSPRELKIILDTPEFKTLYDENASKAVMQPKLIKLWEQIQLKIMMTFLEAHHK